MQTDSDNLHEMSKPIYWENKKINKKTKQKKKKKKKKT